ncbi:MAG TPA: hypothetical protein VJV74_08490 [Terriglobia bacterium]|nr:hypothetical protein [Terriglobia bacterium]
MAKFEVDFSSGYCDTATDNDVPFTGKDGKDKKQFTETDSAGTVKNLKPNSPYSICYYKYSITVDGKTTYDPGVIITKP